MRVFLFLLVSLVTLSLSAQIYNPVKWSVTLTPAGDGNYTFLAKATIDEGWWVYSQYLENEDGPIATTVNFDDGSHYKLVGKNKESDNAKKIFDKVFEMEVVKFQKYYTIEQKIKVTDPSKPITGYVNFMTCNDERCLPPTDKEFELFAPGGSTGAAGTAPADKKITPDQKKTEKASPDGDVASAEKKKTGEESPVVELNNSAAFSNTDNFAGASTDQPSGILKPVKWTFRSEKTGDGLYNIIAEASIEDGWHIYGPGQHKQDGPVPTSFVLKPDANNSIEGNLEESSSNRIEGHDKYFDMQVVKFKHDLKLTRRIKSTNPASITGSLEFMACDETKCLAPEYIEFEIDLTTGQEIKEIAESTGPNIDDKGFIDQRIESLKSSYAAPVSDCGEKPKEEKGNLLWMFIFGMINGFVALLTPCVFPMIPLTVSFFTKDTKRKGWENGLWYGASIIAIYVVLGLIITVLFGAGSLNELSTNPLANTIFFLIFVLFAFSFFGFYEITLPSSWSNKSDAMADKGG